jgi:hypothetical protein
MGVGFDQIVGSCIPGMVLVAAAGLKAWSPRSIEPVWNALGLGESMLPLGAALLVLAEALIGMGLILLPLEHRWRMAAIVMLASFTLLLLWILTRVDPPRCGCLGSLGLTVSARAEAAVSPGKTLVLPGMVVWGRPGGSTVGPRAYNSSRCTRPSPAPSSTATS